MEMEGMLGSRRMTAIYFRDLAARCRKAARDCFDLYAKEEFRRLASEFSAKAEELEGASAQSAQSRWWSTAKPAQFIDR
jgi:hypothetical protein